MKFQDTIQSIPENDWIEVITRSESNYQKSIGKAPKFTIKGPVLDFEVLQELPVVCCEEFITHPIIVSV
ncbi:hypothetical protein [Lactococcus fujiensis]|nr:hypothetical protein [Lactococcus fujiensis]